MIVALGMLGVIEAVTQAARNGTYLREKTLAHWIAMNLITERRLAGAPPDITETKGDVEYAGQRWHWTMKVTQTQVETIRRMDVDVRAAEAPEGTAPGERYRLLRHGDRARGRRHARLGWVGRTRKRWHGQDDAGNGERDTDDGNGNGSTATATATATMMVPATMTRRRRRRPCLRHRAVAIGG